MRISYRPATDAIEYRQARWPSQLDDLYDLVKAATVRLVAYSSPGRMGGLLNGSPVAAPLYREVRRRLLDSLAGGVWAPGDALPPEAELAKRYTVSIGTLRKAVDELVADGILVRQQGRGTFVARHNRDRLLFYFFHVVAADGRK